MTFRMFFAIPLFIATIAPSTFAVEQLKVGLFDVDASPPAGSPLAYDPTKDTLVPLSCRGIVLLGAGKPIVLCAVDWIGIGNDGHQKFREALAKGAGTSVNRVAVHTLHQHDAPHCDLSADQLLAQYGINHHFFDAPFLRDVMSRAGAAAKQAVADAKPVTHVGLGEGVVEKVASNRRILGKDGKVAHVRWTATKDPKVRAMPVGTIDAKLKMISFWTGDKQIAALTYYATHPQRYARTGLANPDFPGMARNARQEETGVAHIHFNGAGGNIGAGKWNDGSPENRQVLADRVANGMRAAMKNTKTAPITASDIAWKSIPVKLPAAPHLDANQLQSILQDKQEADRTRLAAARNLIWLKRCKSGDTIDISCLSIGGARVLHLPGELFVEYQLAAQELRSDLFIATAAYGDYAPGYIGTEIGYSQGGYETSQRASRVASSVEGILMDGIKELLK